MSEARCEKWTFRVFFCNPLVVVGRGFDEEDWCFDACAAEACKGWSDGGEIRFRCCVNEI